MVPFTDNTLYSNSLNEMRKVQKKERNHSNKRKAKNLYTYSKAIIEPFQNRKIIKEIALNCNRCISIIKNIPLFVGEKILISSFVQIAIYFYYSNIYLYRCKRTTIRCMKGFLFYCHVILKELSFILFGRSVFCYCLLLFS